MSVIGAIDAFTAQNGGTVIIPGSHAWGPTELAALRGRGGPAAAIR